MNVKEISDLYHGILGVLIPTGWNMDRGYLRRFHAARGGIDGYGTKENCMIGGSDLHRVVEASQNKTRFSVEILLSTNFKLLTRTLPISKNIQSPPKPRL